MKTLKLLLLIMTISACSGSGGGGGNPAPPTVIVNDLTSNSFTYSGTIPPTINISYSNKAGDLFSVHGAYSGLIEIFTTPDYDLNIVKSAVSSISGTIVAQTPKLGIYVIQVATGTEASSLQSLYLYSWVLDGNVVVPASFGGNLTFDWNSANTNDPCLDRHGDLVTNIANRRGGNTFTLEPVSAHAKIPQSLADLMLRKFQAVPVGEHQIISMSLGFDLPPGEGVVDYITTSCDISCAQKMVAMNEYNFLRRFYDAMEQLYLTNPDVANRNAVSIISGNTGVALDAQLAALKTNFPNAAKRIVIVGGIDENADIDTRDHFNFVIDKTSGNIIYARGDNVHATSPATGDQICSGTSYAAPEVGSILEYLWSRNPTKTSEQILKAIKQALASRNGAIPQDANGLTTQAFLDEVLNILTPPTCSSFTYSAWGSCLIGGTQSRTVTSSLPANCVGGSPVITQSCIYSAPACSYSYSLWGSCINNVQTRSVIGSSPQGCVGTPVTSQSCNLTCHICNFDVYCTVYGFGGCWRCTNSTYVNQICQGSGLAYPGACVNSSQDYTVCQ